MNFTRLILLFASIPGLSFGIHLVADHATYKTENDSLIYVEIFYSLERSELPFERDTSGRWSSNFVLSLAIEKDDHTIIDSTSWPLAVSVTDKNELNKPYYIYDYLTVLLYPGKYVYKLRVKFEKQEYNAEISDTMKISMFLPTTVSMSDIMFISSISDAIRPSKFEKDGKIILPNPSRIYTDEIPIAYFFAELYKPKNDTNNYAVQVKVHNKSGKLIRDFDLGTLEWNENKSAILNGFSIAGLPDDEYTMTIGVIHDSQVITQKGKNFFVVKQASRKIEEDKYLKDEEHKLSLFATSAELALFKSLSKDAKLEFLNEFWNKRGKDFKKVVDERYEYASVRFARGGKKEPNGWETDQGRIFIKYGPPDNIERHEITLESNPWEKWEYYNIEKGLFFIFADLYNTGEMKLVHSNAKGEFQDENWMRKITRMPSGIFQEER